MLSPVLNTINRHALFPDSAARRILCAVSGGPDSMALLACLWELAPRLALTIEVATVDHGLRPEAEAELALVAERAADLGVPWHPIRVDVRETRETREAREGRARAPRLTGATRDRAGGGIQEVARRLRLAALADLAARRGLGRVALGHQADDQAETVLFRILRGTGLKGLAGIPYLRTPFVRPLLDVTRAQILRYLGRRSVPYVTDPSNADQRYARARLRERVLPLLRRENPRVDRALCSLAASASAAAAAAIGIDGDALGATASGGRVVHGGFQIDASLAEKVEDGLHIPTRVRADIQAAVSLGHGTRCFDVAGGRRVTVSYGQIDVGAATGQGRRQGPRRKAVATTTEEAEATLAVTVHGPGTYRFGRWVLSVVLEESEIESEMAFHATAGRGGGEGTVTDGGGWCWFDAGGVSWPLRVRGRTRGDRMRPRGGTGSRKLADLLIDAKVPRRGRDGFPVVTTLDDEILFVPGLRPSGTASPGTGTTRRIGLAAVADSDHDALVDRPIARGNTEGYPYQNRLLAESDRGRDERQYQVVSDAKRGADGRSR